MAYCNDECYDSMIIVVRICYDKLQRSMAMSIDLELFWFFGWKLYCKTFHAFFIIVVVVFGNN